MDCTFFLDYHLTDADTWTDLNRGVYQVPKTKEKAQNKDANTYHSEAIYFVLVPCHTTSTR
ncbi:MAG: hypothetical protein SPL21_12015 [Fibrobacter sp.]|nr:hypothetical protein [Fibrobacter sp.]